MPWPRTPRQRSALAGVRRRPSPAPRRASLRLVGLAPLDLLGGRVEVEVELKALSAGKLHDDLFDRLPELAVDLQNGELLRFMSHLARGGAVPDDVRGAHDLMLRRLAADWQAVVSRGDNSYRKDLKNGSRTTALGEMVWLYRSQSGSFAQREVFTDLEPRIKDLAKSRKGSHPFLRRSMKKLARQMKG